MRGHDAMVDRNVRKVKLTESLVRTKLATSMVTTPGAVVGCAAGAASVFFGRAIVHCGGRYNYFQWWLLMLLSITKFPVVVEMEHAVENGDIGGLWWVIWLATTLERWCRWEGWGGMTGDSWGGWASLCGDFSISVGSRVGSGG
jgi:hypothetical protein